MSKIDRIEKISSAVSATTMVLHRTRCASMRYWHSRCRKCLDACPHDAIKRTAGHLDIDSQVCTNCGSCAAACPTGTFATSSPSQTEIVRQARKTAEEYNNIACFACERLAGQLFLDTERVVVLPCLDYLDEYLLIGLLSCGIKNVAVFKQSCEGCTICGTPRIEATVKRARNLCKDWNVSGKPKLFSEVPPELCGMRGPTKSSGESKRDAFKGTGGSLLGYAVKNVDEVFGAAKQEPKKRSERVYVEFDDKFDANTCRSGRLLAMLSRLGTPPHGKTIESGLWASVNIDTSTCRRCGMCAKLCPTDALHYEQPTAPRERGQKRVPATLVFTPSACINCGLCKDSCYNHSLLLSTRIPADQLLSEQTQLLYDDEPPEIRKSSCSKIKKA